MDSMVGVWGSVFVVGVVQMVNIYVPMVSMVRVTVVKLGIAQAF